jgi:hypothetical protein
MEEVTDPSHRKARSVSARILKIVKNEYENSLKKGDTANAGNWHSRIKGDVYGRHVPLESISSLRVTGSVMAG